MKATPAGAIKHNRSWAARDAVPKEATGLGMWSSPLCPTPLPRRTRKGVIGILPVPIRPPSPARPGYSSKATLHSPSRPVARSELQSRRTFGRHHRRCCSGSRLLPRTRALGQAETAAAEVAVTSARARPLDVAGASSALCKSGWAPKRYFV